MAARRRLESAMMRHARVTGVLLALVAAGCGGAAAGDPPAPGSTLRVTLVDRDGDGALERGPGEPLRDRTELGGGGTPGEVLATWAQITDTQVRDEESPARVPFLDRLGGPFRSTFRAHEALSAHVLAASVRAVNALRPEAVVVTGDIADNAQANELELAGTLLDGGRARPDSGAPGYEGVQDAGNPDPLIYRPDNDAPRHPGLLARAQRPFDTPGLDAPWYPALGNHDVLAQGETPATRRIQAVARGGEAVWGLDPGLQPGPDTDSAAAVEALLGDGLPGRTRRVPADPARRLLTPDEAVERLGRDRGRPGGRLDYTFDVGRSVRGVVLDTVRREGGARGVVSAAQAAWLERELERAGRRYVVVFSHNPLDASDGGEAALAALDRTPTVVAAVSGNRHRNVIAPRAAGPYWLIGTSSLADFPQQARAFRLVRTAHGVALETFMLDHDGSGLAGVARELAFLDAQGGRPQHFQGARADRNARLHLPAGG
jgi:3',5'-cyclic AMP phosphodiesterase CpdA